MIFDTLKRFHLTRNYEWFFRIKCVKNETWNVAAGDGESWLIRCCCSGNEQCNYSKEEHMLDLCFGLSPRFCGESKLRNSWQSTTTLGFNKLSRNFLQLKKWLMNLLHAFLSFHPLTDHLFLQYLTIVVKQSSSCLEVSLSRPVFLQQSNIWSGFNLWSFSRCSDCNYRLWNKWQITATFNRFKHEIKTSSTITRQRLTTLNLLWIDLGNYDVNDKRISIFYSNCKIFILRD